nr:MAG TPA: hypothetical protein [Caudoviricetes sp.]
MLDYSFFYMYIFMIKPLSLISVFLRKEIFLFLYQQYSARKFKGFYFETIYS